jgi:hypothetical protein
MRQGRAEKQRPVALSGLLGVEPHILDQVGAFDAVLNLDTPLFVDPALLKTAPEPELSRSYDSVKDHFRRLFLVISRSEKKGDLFWRQAARMLLFPEAQNICIGYSARSTAGRGMGAKLRDQILETADVIIRAGLEQPELFEIMGHPRREGRIEPARLERWHSAQPVQSKTAHTGALVHIGRAAHCARSQNILRRSRCGG